MDRLPRRRFNALSFLSGYALIERLNPALVAALVEPVRFDISSA